MTRALAHAARAAADSGQAAPASGPEGPHRCPAVRQAFDTLAALRRTFAAGHAASALPLAQALPWLDAGLQLAGGGPDAIGSANWRTQVRACLQPLGVR